MSQHWQAGIPRSRGLNPRTGGGKRQNSVGGAGEAPLGPDLGDRKIP